MMSPSRLKKGAAALLGWLTALAVLLLTGCAPTLTGHPAQLSYPPLSFHPPTVDSFTLRNGVRVYLREDNELPLVRVTAMVGSGALAAPPELAGFDELYAETLRSGGSAYLSGAEIEERLDLLAADLGCSMGPYTTQLDLSLRRDDLAAGLAVVSELLLHPAFAGAQLDIARSKALEGLRRRNDDPEELASRALLATLYPDHPLGRFPTVASLAAVSRESLLTFHWARVVPGNLWLAVSGDVRRGELAALLEAAFGDWPVAAAPASDLPPVIPPAGGMLQLISRELPQATILLGDLGLTKDDPDQYAGRVMNFIFGGGGFNSRLMREIRSDRGLAYSAWSQFQVGRRLPGPVMAGTETKNASVGEALGLIRTIMAELRETPVSEEELRVARDSLVNSFVFSFADSHSVVVQRLHHDFYGYPAGYLETYRERLAAVTAADVQRVARRFLQPDRQQVVVVGAPPDQGAGLEMPGMPVRRLTPDQLP